MTQIGLQGITPIFIFITVVANDELNIRNKIKIIVNETDTSRFLPEDPHFIQQALITNKLKMESII